MVALGVVIAATDGKQQRKQHGEVKYEFVSFVVFGSYRFGECSLVFGEGILDLFSGIGIYGLNGSFFCGCGGRLFAFKVCYFSCFVVGSML